jgi:hypothetical protein
MKWTPPMIIIGDPGPEDPSSTSLPKSLQWTSTRAGRRSSRSACLTALSGAKDAGRCGSPATQTGTRSRAAKSRGRNVGEDLDGGVGCARPVQCQQDRSARVRVDGREPGRVAPTGCAAPEPEKGTSEGFNELNLNPVGRGPSQNSSRPRLGQVPTVCGVVWKNADGEQEFRFMAANGEKRSDGRTNGYGRS